MSSKSIIWRFLNPTTAEQVRHATHTIFFSSQEPNMSFDLQPTLSGKLVHLRPLLETDHDALFAVASDELIWEQHPAKTRSEPAGFRALFEESLKSGGALIAIDAATGEVIGSSRFHCYNELADEVEIGWTFLARSRWGGNFNREMKHLMLQHAFRFVGRVVFVIAPENERSQRAVAKIGASRVADRSDSTGRVRRVFQIEARCWGPNLWNMP